jgi:HD-GYP domain-containing protein (c-di-GMP phosphodiesterase class II)
MGLALAVPGNVGRQAWRVSTMEALAKSTSIEIELDLAPAIDPAAYARILRRLTAGLEVRVPGSAGHSRRVSRYAAGIARQMGLPREQVARVRRAAAVHDIGKLEMPARIVNKPGPLDADEFALVKRHAEAGERMVAGLGDEELTAIVRHHHERLDGSGYPDGLTGEEIPLGARIVAVADTFDALTSVRPYRSASRHRDALVLLSAEAGAQLDPDAVRAFCDYYTGPRRALARLLAQ